VAFSHDNKTQEARTILETIAAHHQLPDPYLFLSELADYEGNVQAKQELVSMFYNKASQPKYEGMYNKYLIKLAVEERNDPQSALSMAQAEVEKRPTPETYSWLALAYSASHREKEAVDIVEKYVAGKTFEPEALQAIGFTYKLAGETQKAKHFFKEALGASYELGPMASRQIEKSL
jgi:tetratricopeptide (TPR) repeat protein